MTMELAFSIILGIAMSVVGLLVKRLYGENDIFKNKTEAEIKHLRTDLHDIALNYQTKEDGRQGRDEVMTILRGIERKLEKIDEKMDRKADK